MKLNNFMIPKIIHWCWVGPDEPPKFIKECIETWKNVLPDYEIKLWDAKSFDMNSVLFVKQAFDTKSWAFVADYIRLYALYNYGGIYLDSDVKVFKRFDKFLKNKFFSGIDVEAQKGVIGPEAAIMGSIPQNDLIKEFMTIYENRPFLKENGEKDKTVTPILLGSILEHYGFEYKDDTQHLKDDITIYSTKYFCNTNSVKYRKINYAFHINSSYWVFGERTKFAQFFWKHNKMGIYHKIANIISKIKKL